jgi:replicative DNA helicase
VAVPVIGREGRVPPHDLEAEASVLGAILLDPAAIMRVLEFLNPEDFYRENHGQVYRAALSLFREGEPIDNVTIAAELEKMGVLDRVGGRAQLAMLQESVPTAANVEHYARIVKDRAYKRRLITAGTQVTQLGFEESLDADEAVNQAQAHVYAISDDKVGAGLERLYDLLKPAMDRIDAQMAAGGGVVGIPTGFHDLDRMTNGFKESDMVVIAGRPSMGKALALDTPIPTPDGWRTMGELRVGDQVFDEQGRPCTVTYATSVQIDHDCYEVVFSDGARIVADGDHQWLVWDHAARKSVVHYASGRTPLKDPYRGVQRRPSGRWAATGWVSRKSRRIGTFDDREAAREAAEAFRSAHGQDRGDRPRAVTTREMIDTLYSEGGARLNYSIPLAAPLKYPAADLPLDPYVLGVWLGDGTTSKAEVTLDDPEIVAELRVAGCPARREENAKGTPRFTLSYGRYWRAASKSGGRPPVLRTLRSLGVLGRKHLPTLYRQASVEQRIALLQGLMDTDGSIDALGHVEFCSTDYELAEGVQELALGLGLAPRLHEGRATLDGVDCGPKYRVRFKPADIPVFRLSRKAVRQLAVRPGARVRNRYVASITPTASVPVRCIQVDSPSHLYLAGRACVATHNTSFILNVALHAAIDQKKTVAIFSLEMSQEQLVERMLCEQARIDAQRLHRGILSDVEYERLARALGPLGEAPIYIDDAPRLDDLTLRLKARQAKSREGVEMIIIDYLQLMHGRSQGGDNRVQEVSGISRSLKSIARELRVPVIAISQLSRAPEARPDKRPILSDLRESGSIEQDADLVMFLYRDDYYNREKSERPGVAEIIVAKHRNGPTGMVELMFRKELTRFENLDRRRPEVPAGPDS